MCKVEVSGGLISENGELSSGIFNSTCFSRWNKRELIKKIISQKQICSRLLPPAKTKLEKLFPDFFVISLEFYSRCSWLRSFPQCKSLSVLTFTLLHQHEEKKLPDRKEKLSSQAFLIILIETHKFPLVAFVVAICVPLSSSFWIWSTLCGLESSQRESFKTWTEFEERRICFE